MWPFGFQRFKATYSTVIVSNNEKVIKWFETVPKLKTCYEGSNFWTKGSSPFFITGLGPLKTSFLSRDWKVLTLKKICSEEVWYSGSKGLKAALKFWHYGFQACVSSGVFKAYTQRRGWKVLSEKLWMFKHFTAACRTQIIQINYTVHARKKMEVKWWCQKHKYARGCALTELQRVKYL